MNVFYLHNGGYYSISVINKPFSIEGGAAIGKRRTSSYFNVVFVKLSHNVGTTNLETKVMYALSGYLANLHHFKTKLNTF